MFFRSCIGWEPPPLPAGNREKDGWWAVGQCHWCPCCTLPVCLGTAAGLLFLAISTVSKNTVGENMSEKTRNF